MLRQALFNLLLNAAQAVAPDGHIEVVTLRSSSTEAVLEVRDNGPGVPAEHLTDVFTDGFSTKPARDGLRRGIGLALVQRLVHRAGGRIEAMPGPGGQFVVQLPRTAELAGAGVRDANR